MPELEARISTASAAGFGRPASDDALASRTPSTTLERLSHGTVWALADGIGQGGRGGEFARAAVAAVVSQYWDALTPDPAERLSEALEHANAVLFAANDPEVSSAQRAGATCLAAALVGERLLVAHAGRSRAYLLRAGALQRLTDDHTWVAEQVRAGLLDPDETPTHPRRNMLTRALGIRPSVPVDQHSVALAPGDIVLLCSDGLHRFLAEERIAAILGAPGSDDPAAALVAAVAEQHGRDDVTVVVVAVQPAERAQSPASDYLSLLLRVGPELARGLDVDRTQSTVLQRLLELTGGERAAILLTGAGPGGDEFVLRAGHDLATSEQHVGFSRAIARRSVAERAPVLLADALGAALSEPGAGDRSVVIQGIRAAVCVPLRSGDAVLGALYVDSLSQANRFDAATVDLLEAFAALAAPAIENARLHAELSGRTRELEAVRHTQDSLVRSLSSALVALDARDCITEWNPAAAELFQVSREAALGRSLGEVTPPGVANWLIGMQVQAEAGDRSLILGNTWDGAFGARARVVLAGRVARIHDGSFDGGHVFIINDRTDITLVEEARREQQAAQERQRALFSRYLAPAVVERALRSPDDVQLGGARQQVTILFADVRGFTGYSEAHSAEAVVDALNTYLALATNEIFAQFGTLDKFLGDGVMAIFGAPLPLEQHAAAAVRAALAIRERALALRRERGAPFAFGFGINTGDAVVGNIGAQQLMNYTAIGDTVNVASRLEEAARAGEVLITQATLDACAGAFAVEELGPLYVKGRAEPIATYKVIAAN